MTTHISGTTGVDRIADGTIVTADIQDEAVTKAELETEVKPIGVDQTWQDVLAGRAKDVVYTNTTGRPIQVSICAFASSTTTGTLTVDGVVVGTIYASGTGLRGIWSVIIPAGSTYIVSGASTTLVSWAELR